MSPKRKSTKKPNYKCDLPPSSSQESRKDNVKEAVTSMQAWRLLTNQFINEMSLVLLPGYTNVLLLNCRDWVYQAYKEDIKRVIEAAKVKGIDFERDAAFERMVEMEVKPKRFKWLVIVTYRVDDQY